MTDGLSTLYQDLLGGSYDCVDRIVLNAYFRMGHDPGGFRVWWRTLTGSDETLENAYLMRLAGRFSRRIRGLCQSARHSRDRLFGRTAQARPCRRISGQDDGHKHRPKNRRRTKRSAEWEVAVERPTYDLTIFKLHCGKLTLKIYTKGERVLRMEAIAHNTPARVKHFETLGMGV